MTERILNVSEIHHWRAIRYIPNPYIDTTEQKQTFQNQPSKLVEHAKFLENQVNSNWEMYIKGSPIQLEIAEKFRARTADIIKDAQLADNMTPKWSVGCRYSPFHSNVRWYTVLIPLSSRITPGDPYMLAIQKPNVNMHFTEVVEITDNSIVGKDGTKKEIDTIICATGKI
jgi:hydroxyversicolorone monooxygenase